MSLRLACIIGWPVAHSLSPAMHNAAFAAAGLPWTYVPIAVRPGSAKEGIELLRTLGVDGANVTMPHKEAVIPYLDGLSEDAGRLRAVNTIVRDGARLEGHTTDGEGFVRFLRADVALEPDGARAHVLGAGGAARAVALALARAGAGVTVAARHDDRAAEAAALDERIGARAWAEPVEADLVVNATPAREGLPLDRLGLREGVAVVDLIYAPPETDLVAAARRAGARAYDGLGMLLHQGALSFELWTQRAAPLEVMRDALARAIVHDDAPEGTELPGSSPAPT